MKKDDLILKKKKIVSGMPYPYDFLFATEENMKMFSCNQLEKLVTIAQDAKKINDEKSPFFVLSATEVLQKETGRIADFTDDGIREETEDEVLSGAAQSIYKRYVGSNLDLS